MHYDAELIELIQSFVEKSLDLMMHFKAEPAQLFSLIEKYLDISRDFLALSPILLNHSEQFEQMQRDYWQDAWLLFQENVKHWQIGEVIPINDKRFASEAWIN